MSVPQSGTHHREVSGRRRGRLLCAIGVLGMLNAAFALAFPAGAAQLSRMDAFIGRGLEQYAILGEQLRGISDQARLASRIPVFSKLGGAHQYAAAHGQLAQLSESAASEQISSGQLEEAVCRALAQFRTAVTRQPANVRYHLAVADAASRLGVNGRSCSKTTLGEQLGERELLALSFRHLELARKLAPHDTTMLYLSALLYFRLGEKEQGLERLRLTQEINPHFSPEQQEYFINLVKTERELEHALSGELGHVMLWAEHFRKHNPDRFQQWEHVFAKAALSSLDKLATANDVQQDERRLHDLRLGELARSMLTLRNDALRRKLDALLAERYQQRGDRKWSTVLAERRTLARIPVLKSFLAGDASPESVMLYSWKSDRQTTPVRLARTGFALGAYVPEGFEVKMIVVENEHVRWRPSAQELEVRISGDNQSFSLLRQEYRVRSLNVGGREQVVLSFPGFRARYFKIGYRGAAASGVLKNDAARLLQVYGTGQGS